MSLLLNTPKTQTNINAIKEKGFIIPIKYNSNITKNIIYKLLHFIPKEITEYKEPFFSSTLFFLYIKKIFGNNPKKYWINDTDISEYYFWKELKSSPKEIVGLLEYYYENFSTTLQSLHEMYEPDINIGMPFDTAIRKIILDRIETENGYEDEYAENRFTEEYIQSLKICCGLLQKKIAITNCPYKNLFYEEDNSKSFYFINPNNNQFDITILSHQVINLSSKYMYIVNPEHKEYVVGLFKNHGIYSLQDDNEGVEKILITNYDMAV